MRKAGMKRWLLGAIAGAATLAGCGDNGRSWAMVAQDDYMPHASASPGEGLRRGSNTGLPRHLPDASPASRDGAITEGSAMGGSGIERMSPPVGDQGLAGGLWLKQDFRVPYPQSEFEARVAEDLGTGKPLRANAKGIWTQGTYAVEMGSGISRSVSPESAPYQPQEQNINGNISTPQSPPWHQHP